MDKRDKKLISTLDFNARASYSELGKAIGLSKQGAEYRLKRLEEKGIIKGHYPVINVPKLGYIYCRLLLTLKNVTREKKQEIAYYLKKRKEVFWLFSMQGNYDYLIVIWAKTVTEFRKFIDIFTSDYHENVKEVNETIATDVIHLHHRYLTDEKKRKEIHLKETEQRYELDETDRKLLSALASNARKSLVEVSQEINESAKVAAYRMRKLEKNGIILGYRPALSHHLLGYTYYKIFIRLGNKSAEEISRIKEYIKNSPIVIYIVEGIGLPGDLDIEVMVENNNELFQFMEKLRFKFPKSIEEYSTEVFMETLKVEYFPF